jgi:hypothetical protein
VLDAVAVAAGVFLQVIEGEEQVAGFSHFEDGHADQQSADVEFHGFDVIRIHGVFVNEVFILGMSQKWNQ